MTADREAAHKQAKETVNSRGFSLASPEDNLALAYLEVCAELAAEKEAHADIRHFHDAAIKELYRILGVDGSDGEIRFKWTALAAKNVVDRLAAAESALAAERTAREQETIAYVSQMEERQNDIRALVRALLKLGQTPKGILFDTALSTWTLKELTR